MKVYEFIIKDKNGNKIATLDSALDRSFELYLNKAGAASFSLNPLDPKVTADLLLLGNKELYIYRYGVLVWGGELTYRNTTVDDRNGKIIVNAKGFFDLLDKKILGSPTSPFSYTNTDLSDIAWNAIDTAQTGTNASFGITQGSLATSRNADRNIDSYKTVKEIIEGLSNLNVTNGIDFEIDANKQFSTYYPQKGKTLQDIVFEWGNNIISFTENLDATGMANEVIALGEGQGTEMLTSTQDTVISGLQSTYKIRQKVISHKDVSLQTTLDEHANNELDMTQTQQQILTFRTRGDMAPAYGSYVIGDSIRVKIEHGTVNIDGYYRIVGIKVRIGDGDIEDIDITLNS